MTGKAVIGAILSLLVLISGCGLTVTLIQLAIENAAYVPLLVPIAIWTPVGTVILATVIQEKLFR